MQAWKMSRSFFRRFYVPSNASLAIVGDLEEEEALRAGGTLFRADSGRERGDAAPGCRAAAGRDGSRSCFMTGSSSTGFT